MRFLGISEKLKKLTCWRKRRWLSLRRRENARRLWFTWMRDRLMGKWLKSSSSPPTLPSLKTSLVPPSVPALAPPVVLITTSNPDEEGAEVVAQNPSKIEENPKKIVIETKVIERSQRKDLKGGTIRGRRVVRFQVVSLVVVWKGRARGARAQAWRRAGARRGSRRGR